MKYYASVPLNATSNLFLHIQESATLVTIIQHSSNCLERCLIAFKGFPCLFSLWALQQSWKLDKRNPFTGKQGRCHWRERMSRPWLWVVSWEMWWEQGWGCFPEWILGAGCTCPDLVAAAFVLQAIEGEYQKPANKAFWDLLQVQSCLTEIHAQGRDLQWGTVWHCRKGPAILTKLYTTLRSQYLGFRVHCGLWVTRFNLPFFQRCEVKRILYQLPCMLSWLWVAYLVTQYTFCVSKATQGWSWELGFVTVLLTHCQVT